MSTGLQNLDAIARALAEKMRSRSGGIAPAAAPKAPACTVCGGTGWVTYDVPLPMTDPRFGNLLPCPGCAPVRTIGLGGLRLDEEKLTWQAIKPSPMTVVRRGLSRDIDGSELAGSIRQYLADCPGGFVYLHGGPGQAKSLILKTAVAEAVREGQDAWYTDLASILDDIRDAFDSHNPRDSALLRFERWKTIKLLAIDELDKINPTDWAAERMFALLNYRYEEAINCQSQTLVASNCPPEKINPALASRARDGRGLCIELRGKDARPGMERKKGTT